MELEVEALDVWLNWILVDRAAKVVYWQPKYWDSVSFLHFSLVPYSAFCPKLSYSVRLEENFFDSILFDQANFRYSSLEGPLVRHTVRLVLELDLKHRGPFHRHLRGHHLG